MIENAPSQNPTHRKYYRKRITWLIGFWLGAAIFLWQAVALPPPSRPSPVAASTFPTIVGTIMLISATGMLLQAIWCATHPSDRELALHFGGPAQEESTAETGPNGEDLVASPVRLIVGLVATTAYAVLFFPLGYLLSTVIYVALVATVFWRRPIASVIIAVIFTVVVAWLFSLLGISLPPGLLSLKF